jgi:regulatory protein YycI of two-component signal transduction system YycFG
MVFNFQKTVATIAIIIFIILMIFIASVLYNNKYGVEFPPTVSECPDYWIDTQNISSNDIGDKDSQTKQTCFNIKNLGNSACQKTMDFTGDFWKGSTGECNKYKWAKGCDLTWDGISNNPNVCM